jgi:hypothetical protein
MSSKMLSFIGSRGLYVHEFAEDTQAKACGYFSTFLYLSEEKKE